MTTFAGTLASVEVEYARTARYRRRGQTQHHRAPRYTVRYRFEGHAPCEATVEPDVCALIVWRIRGSRPGDLVEVRLGADGQSIIEWTNRTQEERWDGWCGPCV